MLPFLKTCGFKVGRRDGEGVWVGGGGGEGKRGRVRVQGDEGRRG